MRTDGHDEANSGFSQFCETRLKNGFLKYLHGSPPRTTLTEEQNSKKFIKIQGTGRRRSDLRHLLYVGLWSKTCLLVCLPVRPSVNNRVQHIRRISMSSHGPIQRSSPGRRKKLPNEYAELWLHARTRLHLSFHNWVLTYLITYSLTHSMMQSPPWEANWFAASQEIPRISRNPKVHYRTHKRSPPVSILGQPNPVHIPTSHLLEIHTNIIHPSTPRSTQWSLSLRFPPARPYTPSSPHPYAPHAQPIITEYRANSLCSHYIVRCISIYSRGWEGELISSFNFTKRCPWEAHSGLASQANCPPLVQLHSLPTTSARLKPHHSIIV